MAVEPRYPAVRPARLVQAENALESFKRIEEQALALPSERVGRVTTDIPLAASIALGALANLEQLRPEFEALADGGVAQRALAQLPDYALGALYAHLQSMAVLSDNELASLIERAKPLRENLLLVAEGLVGFGIFPGSTVAAVREGMGHVDTAKDLIALAALFNSNWSHVQGKVPFERELVNDAAVLGPRLLRAVGLREVGEVRKDPSLDWKALRERTFRLLVNAYDEVRRATVYVRWHHDDANAFAPSLHARPATGKSKVGAEEPEDTDQEPMKSDQQELGGVVSSPEPVDAGLKGSSPFAP